MPKLQKMGYEEMSLFQTSPPQTKAVFVIPLPSEIRKHQARYKMEFSRHNKNLVSIDASGARGRSDTINGPGIAKKSSLNITKSVNLDNSKCSNSPRKFKKGISFIEESASPIKMYDSYDEFLKANS